MKRIGVLTLAFVLLAALSACAGEKELVQDSGHQEDTITGDPSEDETGSVYQEEDIKLIYADTGNLILEIEPADNSSAEAFISLLEAGDVTVHMHDYGNFEKVGPLGSSFPTNDETITTEPGDVILYQGDQITIYYDTNTWNFTKLGKVRDLSQDELKAALGDGDVTVVFSLRPEH